MRGAVMARYANGKIPPSLLVWDRHGNPWLPGTCRKWVAFQQEVYDRTLARTGKGVWLYVSPKANGAFNTYRDYDGQVAVRQYWTRLGRPLMASVPSRSSHGGNWTGETNGRYGLPRYVQNRDAGAFDVANWAAVPWDIFEAAAAKVGLLVNIVVPEERWHVVDLTPYDAPATAGGTGTPLEDDMPDETWMSGFGNSLREQITGDIKKGIAGWLSGFGNALRTQVVSDVKKELSAQPKVDAKAVADAVKTEVAAQVAAAVKKDVAAAVATELAKRLSS